MGRVRDRTYRYTLSWASVSNQTHTHNNYETHDLLVDDCIAEGHTRGPILLWGHVVYTSGESHKRVTLLEGVHDTLEDTGTEVLGAPSSDLVSGVLSY